MNPQLLAALTNLQASINALVSQNQATLHQLPQQIAQAITQAQQTAAATHAAAAVSGHRSRQPGTLGGRLAKRAGFGNLRSGIKNLRSGNFKRGLAQLRLGGRKAARSLGFKSKASQRIAGGIAARAGSAVAAAGAMASVAAAGIAAVAALKKFADGAIQANREFAQFSGAMANVFAMRDLQEAFRQQRMGSALAPSAREATQSEQRLKNALEPWQVALDKLKNKAATVIYAAFTEAVEGPKKNGGLLNGIVNIWNPLGSLLSLSDALGGGPDVGATQRRNRGVFTKASDYAKAMVDERTEQAKTDAEKTGIGFKGLPEAMKKAIEEGAVLAFEKGLDIFNRSKEQGAINFQDMAESLARQAAAEKKAAAERVRAMQELRKLNPPRLGKQA